MYDIVVTNKTKTALIDKNICIPADTVIQTTKHLSRPPATVVRGISLQYVSTLNNTTFHILNLKISEK